MSDSEPDYDMVRSETWDFPVDPLVGRGDSYKELQSCFLNPRDFPGRFPASKCVLLFGVPGIAQTVFFWSYNHISMKELGKLLSYAKSAKR